MNSQRLSGAVALVTGAGAGLGRSHALALAREGAKIVVNDLGGSTAGEGEDRAAALAVVDEIRAAGGEAVADFGDVGNWDAANAMVQRAIDTFGDLHILINNAGIVRPKSLAWMEEEDVTLILRVHLLGTLATMHFAAAHWRKRPLDGGTYNGRRIINTTSQAGLFGVAEANYAAAKGGVIAATMVAARELARYGVTANAVAPMAWTRMTEKVAPESLSPSQVSPLYCWLASPEAAGINGHMFNVGGGHISVVERMHAGPHQDRPGWSMEDLDQAIPQMVAAAAAFPDVMGFRPGEKDGPPASSS